MCHAYFALLDHKLLHRLRWHNTSEFLLNPAQCLLNIWFFCKVSITLWSSGTECHCYHLRNAGLKHQFRHFIYKTSTSSCFPSLLESYICLSLARYLMEILSSWTLRKRSTFLLDGWRRHVHVWEGCFHISLFQIFLTVSTHFYHSLQPKIVITNSVAMSKSCILKNN